MRKESVGLSLIIVLLFAGFGACSSDGSSSSETDGGGDSDTDSDTDTETEFGDGRVVAIGDHHGDWSQTQAALLTAGVIDDDDKWIGGHTTLVQTGDILDRGDEERAIIDFYEALRVEAASAGGRVINVNGNHEIMNAIADYRYITAGACHEFEDIEGLDTSRPEFDELPDYCKARAAALWPGGPYAQILAEWPMVAVVEDNLLVHGGVLQEHVDYGIDKINDETRDFLMGDGELPWDMVGGGDSSVDWDRTYSDSDEEPSEEECQNLENVLTELGVTRMIVGHSVQGAINSSCGGLVWRVDIGMAEYYGGTIQALEINAEGEITVLEEIGGGG